MSSPTARTTPVQIAATPAPVQPDATGIALDPVTATPATSAPTFGYRIVNTFPHDPNAFTQGLVYDRGRLYEGTGRYGASSLREVELESGRVLRSVLLAETLFGEGIAIVADRIIQLTLRENSGLVYDLDTFELVAEFYYPTEGWGLTYDGQHLVMSDGTAALCFLDPETYGVVRRLQVRDAGAPVAGLNELESVDGVLLANVWLTDRIAMIDPATGQVIGWIDLAGLRDYVTRDGPVDVLNGIGYDSEARRLFVTGKLWPVLFEIELVTQEAGGKAERFMIAVDPARRGPVTRRGIIGFSPSGHGSQFRRFMPHACAFGR